MKKILTIFIILASGIVFIASERHDGDSQIHHQFPFNISQTKMHANQISTWYRNNGSYNRIPSSGNSGFEWPKGSNKTSRYASGLWLGARISGQTRVAVAEYDYEYSGGQIDPNSHAPYGKNDAAYKVYNISPGLPNGGVIVIPDAGSNLNVNYDPWSAWPFSQGAPMAPSGLPLIIGSQMMYYVYTDGYAEDHGNRSGSTLPLGAEIQQTNFCFNFNGALGNMVFQRFKIINKSGVNWDSTYVSLWTDDDIGGSAQKDFVGCDTVLSLGYTYKAEGNDPQYGTPCPAVGFDFFQGPVIDSPGDTAKIVILESQQVVRIPNKKVLGMTSFNKYINSNPLFGDPRNFGETYNYMKGLTKDGAQYINPINNQPTPYVHSGDPVTATGWLDTGPDDRRFMMSTGPFTMRSGDTQIVMTVQLVAKATTGGHTASITDLRKADVLAQKIYDNAFKAPTAFPCPHTTAFAPGDATVCLTWDGSPENVIIENKLDSSVYFFQGYQVYAVRNGTNGDKAEDRKLLATYDLIDSITAIIDTTVDEFGVAVPYVAVAGSNSGIQRHICFTRDPFTNDLFINGSPYRFSVISYGYDWKAGPSSGTPRANQSSFSNCLITVIPQRLTQGTQLSGLHIGDTVDVSYAGRNIAARPTVINPLQLVNANYTLTYLPFSTNNNQELNTLTWSLKRNGSEIVTKYTDVSGKADTAKLIDGILMKMGTILDSGVVRDTDDPLGATVDLHTRVNGWAYNPPENRWCSGPSTSQIPKIPPNTKFRNRQFQSRSMGISHPEEGNYRTNYSAVMANVYYQLDTLNWHSNGLKKVKLVFGQNQKAYRYSPSLPFATDSNLGFLPYRDYVNVPFSAYIVESLDSSLGTPRQVNLAFIDADDNGTWDPDNTLMGKFQLVYVLESSYSATEDPFYTGLNPGLTTGFNQMDIMYVWCPRVNTTGPTTFTANDELWFYPYVITTPNFVPGFPITYNFSTTGTIVGDPSLASGNKDMDKINVFPNPYFGGHRLEESNFTRFVYISNLPAKCNISIYTLNGELIKTINRDNTDPNNSLEKWNLQNQDNVSVASGMYIIYIDAPGIGTKVLKLAIFTPEERISTF